ncbi:MAG TPA: CcmD family protein [Vicinamibacterales bacterium]|jgi:CcmD family protein
MRRLLIVFTSLVLLAVPAFAGQAPAGQSGFVPVDSLPPSEQLPAAPLLISAYAFVWIAVIVYLFTIWRRLNKVEADMRSLANKIQR